MASAGFRRFSEGGGRLRLEDVALLSLSVWEFRAD